MTAAALRDHRSEAAALELIARVHAPQGGLAGESPLVFAPGSQARVFHRDADGAPRGGCVALVRELAVAEERLRVGLVGLVATDPAWRGLGIASAALADAEIWLADRGAALGLLWADDPAFYVARGWRPVGAEIDVWLPIELAGRLPAAEGAMPASPADHAAMHALYERHPQRVLRTTEESRALYACGSMEVCVLERGGAIAAYACRGRGRDLQNAIHEWAGDPDSVLALAGHLLRSAARRGEPGLVLMAPPSAALIARRLEALGARVETGILSMGKVLDRRAAAEALARNVEPAAAVRIEGAGRDARVALEGMGDPLSDDSLLVLLASARGERADIDEFGRALALDCSRLPLTPFAWGLDSI
jgi:GNAT superfamily N-acetyltransferase